MTETESAVVTNCKNNVNVGGGYSYNSISEETSRRITSLRFLLIVFVVFIHNNNTLKSVLSSPEKIIFCPSTFSIWLQLFISDGIARCAVPIFFIFSSYLQFKKDHSYGVLVKKRIRSLVIPYFLWIAGFTVVFFPLMRIVMHFVFPTVLDNPGKIFIYETPLEWIHVLLGNYEKFPEDVVCGPAMVQFWYIRDLFFLVLLSPLIKKAVQFFPLETLFFTSFFFICELRPVIVQSQALFFYTLGLFWAEDKIDFFALADCFRLKTLFVLFIFCVILKGKLYPSIVSINAFVVFSAIFLILKLSTLICKNEKAFLVTKYLAGYSFFLFAIHTYPLMGWIKDFWLKFLPMTNGFFCLAEYFGVSLLVIIIGTGFGIVLKRICPKLFALLTGGR